MVNEVPAAPALANTYPFPVTRFQLLSTAERRNMGAEVSWGGECWGTGTSRTLNCWSQQSWWLLVDSISCWEGADLKQHFHSNLNLSSVPSLQEVLRRACTFSLSVENSLVRLLNVTLISSLCRRVLFNCTGLFCDL